MAPEQALGRPLTAQADVYSFGVVMYELFTNTKPFVGDTVEKIFEQVIYKPIDLELLAKSGAPQIVQELIAKCTAKKLMERPETMAPVYDALEKALAPKAAEAKQPVAQEADSHETFVRLRMLPQPDPNAPTAQNIAVPAINATAPASKAQPPESQMKSLVMAAGGAVLVAFLIYLVVRLSGNY
jgi:serine/threonine protein kinase